MPKRTSINDVQRIEDLNDLGTIVVDKRNDKRADAKKKKAQSALCKAFDQTTDKGALVFTH